VRAVAALVAGAILAIVEIASAQKIVSPPEIAPAPIPSQPPVPSAREQSGPPQTNANTEQQHSADDKRGTEQSPLFVKIQPAEKGSEEATQAEQEKQNQASDRRRSDFIAGFIALAAVIQAGALIATIRVMTRTARRQLRAYVNITGAEFRTVPGGYPPNVILSMKNFGATPARSITFRRFILLALPGTETFDRLSEPITMRDLAPTQDGVQLIVLSEINHAVLGSSEYILFIYGIIDYKDVFGGSRYTEFRFRLLIDEDGIERARFVACPERNRTT
jgi:hypothetical protein